MILYKLDGIETAYGDTAVLRDISLTITRGEFITVIGPNGAGKSTLIKTLAGSIAPRKGEIFFDSRPLHLHPGKSLAREISVVHQLLENILPFSVYEFIRMGRFPHQGFFEFETESDREAIEKSIATAGISMLRNRLLTELSAGERQLVYMARSLAQSSSVIILDEPISHLDIRHAVQIMDMLRSLNNEGTTVLAVLHDINFAAEYSKRLIALKEGRVFADGKPEDIINSRLIEELYDAKCVIIENPVTGKPYIFPLPAFIHKNKI